MSRVLNICRGSEQFDQQTLAMMTLTHDRVCDVLGLRDKPFTREVVAAEIIALAPRYGRDADRLYRDVVKVLRARMAGASLTRGGIVTHGHPQSNPKDEDPSEIV